MKMGKYCPMQQVVMDAILVTLINLLVVAIKFKQNTALFITPNITKDMTSGIGKWSKREFIEAMKHGISPSQKPYYPAFPYSWYSNMQETDILDIL